MNGSPSVCGIAHVRTILFLYINYQLDALTIIYS